MTLKSPAEFRRVSREGKRWAGPAFVMQVLKKNDDPQFRLGLTVSRKVGNAVVRNRAKRRLREMVRATINTRGITSCDIVIIAYTAATTRDFAEMSADFSKGLAATGVAT